MRYLSIFLLLPSLAYAACAPGVNYGSLDISTPSPVCIAYSGSTLGGCSAYCGGGGGGTVCVEFPAATPPIKGPYFSDGNECKLGDGGDDGGGDTGGVDNSLEGQFAKQPNYVGLTPIGDGYVSDLSPGFNSLLHEAWWIKSGIGDIRTNTFNLNNHAVAIQEKMDKMVSSLNFLSGYSTESSNKLDNNFKALIDAVNSDGSTAAISGDMAEIKSMMEQAMSLWSDQSYTLHSINNHASYMSGDLGAIKGMNEMAMSLWSMDSNTLHSINNLAASMSRDLGAIRGMNDWMGIEQINLQQQIAGDLAAIKDAIKDGQGSGGGDGEGEGEGDKTCTGPLCSFTKPSSSSGSALSEVFSVESIDDVKKQIENKDTEISAAMNDIKSVFAPEELTITGTYDNDYHDINGVRVDLSGKSNIELFFNSGPKMAIWFLAVLLAFTILMGGRKNA